MKYVIAHGYIVTANDDMSVPLNSQIIGTVENSNDCITQTMLSKANVADEMTDAARNVLEYVRRLEAQLRFAHAEITGQPMATAPHDVDGDKAVDSLSFAIEKATNDS